MTSSFAQQSVTVIKRNSGTVTDTYSRYQFFPVPVQVLFFSTKSFLYHPKSGKFPGIFRFWYQILLVPVHVLFFGTKFYRYRFLYQKSRQFPEHLLGDLQFPPFTSPQSYWSPRKIWVSFRNWRTFLCKMCNNLVLF